MARRIAGLFAALFALCSLRSAGPLGARPATVIFRGYSGGAQTALPGKPLSFDIGTRDAHDFSIDIFKVDRARFLDICSGNGAIDTGFPSRALRHAVRAVVQPQNQWYATTHVDLPGLPVGLYAVRINAANVAAIHPLDVTTFGVLAEHGPGADVLFAVDLSSFHKRTDVAIQEAAASGSGEPKRVGADGTALVPHTPTSDANAITKATIVAVADDGSLAFASTSNYSYSRSRTSLLQADRPLYRPGNRVSYRLIVRDAAENAFALPTGNAEIKIIDPDGKTVFSDERPFDSFGTANGTYDLPDDAKLGTYRVEERDAYAGSFAVQAYEKPEYVVDVAAPESGNVVAGDVAHFSVRSQYFFGKPAAGLKLHYRAQLGQPRLRWRPHYLRLPLPGAETQPGDAALAQGDIVANAQGLADIAIATTPFDGEVDRDLVLDVDGRDASGKTVTARGIVALSRASFHIGLALDRWFTARGDDVPITITTASQSGRARPNIPVALSFQAFNETESPALPDLSATTDATGVAHVSWHADRDGYIRIVATAKDERGRQTTTPSYLWVSALHYGYTYHFDTTTISAQKSTYAPGETAQLLVTGPRDDVDALVSVSGGATDRVFVQHLATVASTIDVAVPDDAPKCVVSIWIPGPEGFSYGTTALDVAPTPHRLTVTIAPGKPTYTPGETAHFALDVKDENGRPARAEIGVAVVDDAVLALASTPAAGAAFDSFYGRAPYRYAQADWRLQGPITMFATKRMVIGRVAAASALQPGQTVDTYSVTPPEAAPEPSFANLRSDFRDTAYWAAAVETDERGRASISFPWPDNLTSYTTAGLAVTQTTSIGSGDGHALVSKEYLVRLATPRFMRRSDTARFVASANGPKGAIVTRLRFSAPALGIPDRTVTKRFDRYASATSGFDVASGPLGTSLLRLAGTSGNLSDGLQRSLPIESDGVATHARYAGSLPKDDALTFSLPSGAEAGAMRIDLSPSIIARLYANVQLLDVYPYYCVEQTMSAALPLIDVEQLARRSGLPLPAGTKPDAIAAHAIARLKQLQHEDGSWGWWEHDPANPFMTAYALYGLTELRRNGYAVPDDVMQRGIASLKAQLPGGADTLALWGGTQPGSLWNTRAFMFYSLANASPVDVDRKALAGADAHAAQLNPYALSALGLAHLSLGDRAGAEPLFERLKTLAQDDTNFTHWSGGGWHYHWEDDPIETTAYALRFYHAMEPNAPRVHSTIAWLFSQSHGSWWYTTKDTAAAIYALTEAIDPDRSEFSPDESIEVYLGEHLLKTVSVHSAILDANAASIEIPPGDVASGGSLRFVRRGTGSLYWSVDWTRYVRDQNDLDTLDASDARELSAGIEQPFALTRTYQAMRTPWKIGDEIEVKLKIVAKSDAQFVAVEDPLPAGFEYQPRLHESGDNWSGLQFFDDRVVFFTANLSASYPLELTYRLRASTAGTFTAPPPSAYAMYGPPQESIGRSKRVTILP